MSDKTMPTPGPWKGTPGHPSGKFYGVHGPRPVVTFRGIARPCSEEGQANARLIAAAGTAAHEVAQMGYDPVEAVRVLPELLEMLKHHRATVEKWCHYQGNTQQTFDTHLGPIDAVLTRAAGKEGDDV